MKEYDLVLSLGANCSAAGNMKRRGLRRCSFPFDWLYMMDDRPLFWLAEHLGDGLRDLCRKENLVRITPEDAEWSAADARKFKYIDTESGYRFVHLFRRPIETSDEYEKVIGVLRRRVARMFEAVGRSQRVLLLLATGRPLSDEALKKVKAAFERLYPNVCFDMEFLKFEETAFNRVKSVERVPAKGIHVVELSRAINEYDFSLTNFEWSFLDDIRLTSRALRPSLKESLLQVAKGLMRWFREVKNGRMV